MTNRKTRAIVPESLAAIERDWCMSPGLISGDHVYLTGITGQRIDGVIPETPEEQYETAFDNIALILAEGGMTLADMVDVTTFHIGLQEHLDTFRKVWNARVSPPYPAWTAVGVTEFIIPGNFIEVKVVARLPNV